MALDFGYGFQGPAVSFVRRGLFWLRWEIVTGARDWLHDGEELIRKLLPLSDLLQQWWEKRVLEERKLCLLWSYGFL